MYASTPAGVAMGLAWTSHGGSSLYIETIGQKPSGEAKGGSLDFTGRSPVARPRGAHSLSQVGLTICFSVPWGYLTVRSVQFFFVRSLNSFYLSFYLSFHISISIYVLSGNLGDVMKESVRIAATFAKIFLSDNLQVRHVIDQFFRAK